MKQAKCTSAPEALLRRLLGFWPRPPHQTPLHPWFALQNNIQFGTFCGVVHLEEHGLRGQTCVLDSRPQILVRPSPRGQLA